MEVVLQISARCSRPSGLCFTLSPRLHISAQCLSFQSGRETDCKISKLDVNFLTFPFLRIVFGYLFQRCNVACSANNHQKAQNVPSFCSFHLSVLRNWQTLCALGLVRPTYGPNPSVNRRREDQCWVTAGRWEPRGVNDSFGRQTGASCSAVGSAALGQT